MPRSARKLNFMIRNDIAMELETLVPQGQRSMLVNEAILKELALFRRKIQTEKLLVIRNRNPIFSQDDIVKTVRRDRDRG